MEWDTGSLRLAHSNKQVVIQWVKFLNKDQQLVQSLCRQHSQHLGKVNLTGLTAYDSPAARSMSFDMHINARRITVNSTETMAASVIHNLSIMLYLLSTGTVSEPRTPCHCNGVTPCGSKQSHSNELHDNLRYQYHCYASLIPITSQLRFFFRAIHRKK